NRMWLLTRLGTASGASDIGCTRSTGRSAAAVTDQARTTATDETRRMGSVFSPAEAAKSITNGLPATARDQSRPEHQSERDRAAIPRGVTAATTAVVGAGPAH